MPSYHYGRYTEQQSTSSKMLVSPNTSLDLPTVSYAKHFGVRGEQEDLSDLTRRVSNEKGLSYRQIAARSGGTISHVTVSDIINRVRTNFETETLVGLATGLGVPPEQVFAAYSGRPLTPAEVFDSEIHVAFKGYEELSDEDKASLSAIIQMLGSEIQRRRPKRPPNKGKGKGKK